MNWRKIKQLKPDLTNIWKPEKNIRKIIETRVEYDQEDVLFGNNAAYFFEVCSNPDYYEKLYQLGLVKKKTIKAARNAIENMNQETKNSFLIDRIYLIGTN
jgi:ABC-type Fe3+-hydroxamate transport system substrate-binding protein